ncbi:glucosamine kinase [Mycobacterium sp. DL592]|uniref:glucosamine kinase n=1 Tax=Mycobacterium sp. DL592 TaxID=2675524 RepID=UPI00141D816C|nr:glucosamine kinase [Mycobacterium sp. DL592]
MDRELDVLQLADAKRLAVIADDAGHLAALPQVRDAGRWRRAQPGDGAAEALCRLLESSPDVSVRGRFTVHAWAARPADGERSVTVDQTNESVIVGDAAVVKWATHLQEGPHPAPARLEVLRTNGFRFMPQPWGLVTWRPDDGAETLVVNVDEYLPGAVDGWTWAVDKMAEAAREATARPAPVVSAAAEVGTVVAELHAALASTAGSASVADAQRWHEDACATLREAQALSTPATAAVLDDRRSDIEQILAGLGALAGSPVIDGHGDLHVGQVLQCGGRYVVTDFDGNPVLPPQQRVLPIPAALDVAGMAQSLAHVAIVAQRHHDLDPQALAMVDREACRSFLSGYSDRLARLGHAELYDPAQLPAFRLQQVLREIVYAARHLPRWMYVPDAALPALLDERTTGGR